MDDSKNIFELYLQNNCRFGFYVRRVTWHPETFAKVIGIELVEDGKMIPGNPPYFSGEPYPDDHPKAGKKLWTRIVRMEASWIRGGQCDFADGGSYKWIQVFPSDLPS